MFDGFEPFSFRKIFAFLPLLSILQFARNTGKDRSGNGGA
jgi:hypothetical protein